MDYENSWILLAVFLKGNVLLYVSGLDTYADETALRATLKSGYDREVRPSTPTAVTMFYSIRTLQALDITIQAMSTTGWLSMVMTQSYVPNSEWHYDSGFVTPVVRPLCCPMSTYHMIQFHMKFTRLRPFYIINLIVPSVLFSLLMLLTFLLPTESGERFGYSLTILLSYTVLLTISTDMMPTTSKQIPVISVYLLALLVLCSLSVLNVVLTVKMFHLTTTPPKWLQKCGAKVEYIVFLKCCKSKDKVSPSDWDLKVEENENHNNEYEKDQKAFDKESNSDSEKPEKITWCQLAEALDRLCFYIQSTLVISTSVISNNRLSRGKIWSLL